MRWLAMIGALLMLPQAEPDERLTIELQGRTIMHAARSDYRLPAFPLYDPDRFAALSDKLAKAVEEKPRNARFGEAGNIEPEQPGYRLDRRRFTDLFSRYYFGSGPSAFEAPRSPVYPKVDGELLAQIREKAIGYYITYYNARNVNRAHNIALAARAIDSAVVAPNEQFSFNETVGMRTSAKGYRPAPIIVSGELSEGIGGGICQVSSTLFNAIDRAGLKIVRRYSHSRHVPYVLPGRDATVSWGGPDFVFQNTYNQHVLIRAFAAHGSMSVIVYSSDLVAYKPRSVPGMTKRLPKEVAAGRRGSDDRHVHR